MSLPGYTTEKSINYVHRIKILHQLILAVMPHTTMWHTSTYIIFDVHWKLAGSGSVFEGRYIHAA